MRLFAPLFAAGLLAGVWMSSHLAPPAGSVKTPAGSQPRGDSPTERRWTPAEIQARAREILLKARNSTQGPFAEMLAKWTAAELRAALDECLKDPNYILEDGGGAPIMDALFGEWMKRDLNAAISWFDSIQIQTVQIRMLGNLSYRWPAEQAARGLEFVIAHKDHFTYNSPWSILEKNFVASAKGGPQALGKLLERIADEDLKLDFGNSAKVPAGFDFGTFVTTAGFLRTQDESAISGLLVNWMTQDREAAFDWFLANGRAAKLLDQLPEERSQELDYLTWLGGKLNALDPTQCEKLFAFGEFVWASDPSAALSFASKIEEPALRHKVHEQAAQVILRGDVGTAITHLEAIADPARRIEILTALKVGNPAVPDFVRSPVGDQDAELLRTKLRDWHASDSQIEAVLKKIQP
jgi:hypothetical protein